MDLDAKTKLAIYRHFAETTKRPSSEQIAGRIGATDRQVREAFLRLSDQHVLVLEPDEHSIRMAMPFSGIPTQHMTEVGGKQYFANCAWDALGIVAALQQSGVVISECAQTREPLRLEVGLEGPEPSNWLFHSLLPAAKWWDDIVYT